jgi:hypothetical protein
LLARSDEALTLRVRIVNILDYYLGLTAILPEGNEDFYRRSYKYGNYGKPGDFRAESITLEYRVPGGHLLRHPVLTMGLLGMSSVIMKDILTRFQAYTDNYKNMNILKKHSDLRDIYPGIPDPSNVYSAITNESCKEAIKFSEKILGDIMKMVGFKDNQKHITEYFKYVINYLQSGDKYPESIEQNWRSFHNAG